MWGGTEHYSKIPTVAWKQVCQSKKHGGLGIKDYVAWNRATVAKLVWAVASKKDVLWVKWAHGKYLKEKSWSTYKLSLDCSCTWRKICYIRDFFKDWDWHGDLVYIVSKG